MNDRAQSDPPAADGQATARLHDAYRGARVCVTGGAGFIGSHLCDALVRLGASVAVIDDLTSGRLDNLDAVRDRVEFVSASILDRPALTRAVAGASIIFHQAAVASVPRSVQEPELYQRINVMGTLEVLEAARAAKVGRVVFASSSSVYGDNPALPKAEHMPVSPCSPYAASKCAGEHLMRAYACCYDLVTVSLRYFNIFGARQRADSPYAAVVPTFADAVRRGVPALVNGDGTQTRDFTHIDNAVHANLLAGATERPLRGEAVNVASGGGLSVMDLLRTMAALAGVEPRVQRGPARMGDAPHSSADLKLARRLLGYQPIVGFAEGLRRTMEEIPASGGDPVAARRSG